MRPNPREHLHKQMSNIDEVQILGYNKAKKSEKCGPNTRAFGRKILSQYMIKGLTMKEFFQRVSDKVLLEHLESKGAVLIEGAKL